MNSRIIHPRPNPIVAAMYTLRDIDIDVIVIHGPSGCCFMASRPLEEAGVRVVSSGMRDNDLVFGGYDALVETLHIVKKQFDPKTVAVVGTCASSIIGEDVNAAIRAADIGCNVFWVDCSGCIGDNTLGGIKALQAAHKTGIISEEEMNRQIGLMKSATALEKRVGMATRSYIQPSKSPTKLNACRQIILAFKEGRKVAAVMIAKKELAYRFADLFMALDDAQRKYGGELRIFANLDGDLGLPRIRRYCSDIRADLEAHGTSVDETVGGLDEYAIIGERMKERVDEYSPDLTILLGICHSYPVMSKDDILITDQPRQLSNYLSQGLTAVGEISSHSMVMGTRHIIALETADTLRDLMEEVE